ncbi:hypothetical protein [Clostridium pasteurianum]|nr:hypothetical protein [Clostridium pasteurianum]
MIIILIILLQIVEEAVVIFGGFSVEEIVLEVVEETLGDFDTPVKQFIYN